MESYNLNSAFMAELCGVDMYCPRYRELTSVPQESWEPQAPPAPVTPKELLQHRKSTEPSEEVRLGVVQTPAELIRSLRHQRSLSTVETPVSAQPEEVDFEFLDSSFSSGGIFWPCASFANPNPPDFFEGQSALGLLRSVLSRVKPVNAAIHLKALITATDGKKKFAAVVALLELYDLLWVDLSTFVDFFTSAISYVTTAIPSCLSFFGKLLGLTERETKEVQEEFRGEAATVTEGGLFESFTKWLKAQGVSESILSALPKAAGILLPLGLLVVLLSSGSFATKFLAAGSLNTAIHSLATVQRDWTVLVGKDSFVGSLKSFIGGWIGLVEEDEHAARRKAIITKLEAKLEHLRTFQTDLATNASKLLGDPTIISKFRKEVRDMDRLVTDIAKNDKNMSNARPLLDKINEQLDRLEGLHMSLLSSVTGKQQPATLWLYGVSGGGKSALIETIIEKLSLAEGRTLTRYDRIAGVDFWNGYAGQDVVVYDDFGAAVTDSESLELQQIYTPAAFRVNCAAVEEKKTVFTSRYVLIASNHRDVENSATVCDPSILDRRRDLLVHLVVDRMVDNLPDFQRDYSHAHFVNMKLSRRCDHRHIGRISVNEIVKKLHDTQTERRTAFMNSLTEKLSAYNGQSLVTATHNPVVLFLGDPGLGKTTFARTLGFEVVDEYTTVEGIRDRVLHAYDGEGKPFIMTANVKDHQEFIKTLSEDQATAFLSRITIVNWRVKGLNLLTSPQKVFAQKRLGCISASVEGTEVALTAIINLLTPVTEEIEVPDKAPRHQLPSYDFELSVDYKLLEFPVDLSITKINEVARIERCSVMGGMLYLAPFLMRMRGVRTPTLHTVDEVVVELNLASVAHCGYTIRLKFKDVTLGVMPKGKNSFFFIEGPSNLTQDDSMFVEEALKVRETVAGVVQAAQQGTAALSKPAFAASQFLDGILFLAQATVGIGAIYSTLAPEPESFEQESESDGHGAQLAGEKRTSVQVERKGAKRLTAADNVAYTREQVMKVDMTDYWANYNRSTGTFDGQAANDRQAAALEAVVSPNAVELYSRASSTLMQRALMLGGRLGVTVAHAGSNFNVKYRGEFYPATAVGLVKEKDLLVFRVDDRCPQFPSILKHIPTAAECDDYTGFFATLNIRRGDTIHQKPVKLSAIVKAAYSGAEYTGRAYNVLGGYELENPCTTVAGDCGSFLILHNPKQQRKLIAFHCAASPSRALATHLVRDELEPFVGQSHELASNIRPLPYQEIVPTPPIYGTTPETDKFLYIGVAGKIVDGKPVVNEQRRSTLTQLWRSPFHGLNMTDTVYEPSVLDYRDPRMKMPEGFSVYENAVCKWNNEQMPVNTKLLSYVEDRVASYLERELREANLSLRVLTKKEVLNGASDYAASHQVQRDASPGYPFNTWKEFQGTTKDAALYQGSDGVWRFNDGVGRKVQNCVDQLIDAARQGRRTGVVFACSLKDETLKSKKIVSGGTRAFAASPFDFVIAHRMYNHALSAACASINHRIPMKVGIDASSKQWDDLYNYLTAVGLEGFDGDMAKWDATVPLVFMQAAFRITRRLYRALDPNWTTEQDTIRETLLSHLEGPLLMYFDNIIQSPGGQVSGQPHTAFDNCLVNMMYYFYVWMIKARECAPNCANWVSFEKQVRFAVYGDDNVCCVAPAALEFFNFKTFQEELAKIGVHCTPADKSDVAYISKPLTELTFLKRGFVRDDVISGISIVGPLELSVLDKICSYNFHSTRRHAWQQTNVEKVDPTVAVSISRCLIKEASLQTEEVYMRVVAHLESCARKRGITLDVLPTWREARSRTIWGNYGCEPSLDYSSGFENAIDLCHDCNQLITACLCKINVCAHCKQEICNCCLKCGKVCQCFTGQSANGTYFDLAWDVVEEVFEPSDVVRVSYDFLVTDSDNVSHREMASIGREQPVEPNVVQDDEVSPPASPARVAAEMEWDLGTHDSDSDFESYYQALSNPPVSPPPLSHCVRCRNLGPVESGLCEECIEHNQQRLENAMAHVVLDQTDGNCVSSTAPVGNTRCIRCREVAVLDSDVCFYCANTNRLPIADEPICYSCGLPTHMEPSRRYCEYCLHNVVRYHDPTESYDEPDTSFVGQSAAPAVSSSGDPTLSSATDPGTAIPEPTTVAPPMETVPMASGASATINVIDPWFLEHYVHQTRFTWSTTSSPGTLLWSTPISPQYSHINLAYLAKMYNVWVGGIDYMLKVAGTGFHAGALAIVRLPPNITPEEVADAGSFTYFDYSIIDPKTLECISKSVCDQRRMLYHYTNDSTDKDSIGGYLAIFVLLQLNTSSTGLNQIQVEVFSKASMDFGFLQMRPVNLVTAVDDYSAYAAIFDPHYASAHRDPYYCQGLGVLAQSVESTTNLTAGLRQTDGTWYGLPGFPNQVLEYGGGNRNIPAISVGSWTGNNAVVWLPFSPFWERKVTGLGQYQTFTEAYQANGSPTITAQVLTNTPTAGTQGVCAWENYQGVGLTESSTQVLAQADMSGGAIMTCTGATSGYLASPRSIMGINNNLANDVAEPISAPTSTETLLVFATEDNTKYPVNAGYWLQSSRISELFSSGSLPKIPADAAVLFELYDSATKQPLFEVKLFPEGFMTAPAPTSLTLFDLNKVYAKYQGLVNRTTQLAPITSTTYFVKKTEQWQSQLLASLPKSA